MARGRTTRRTLSTTWRSTMPALAVAAAVALSLAGCSRGRPADVPLTLLVAEQERNDGRTVRTNGTVTAIRDRDAGDAYFVLEDVAQNRVRLVPDETAAAHEGETVTVTGVFRFQAESGRELRVDDITAFP